jgi:hypothetical protein
MKISSMSPEKQFADLLAEFPPAESDTGMIAAFAKADDERRLELIDFLREAVKCFKYDLASQAQTGMRAIEVLWDVLDNPSKYPGDLVAIVEKQTEDMIALIEEGLRGALSQGNTEAASAFERLLEVFRREPRDD